MIGPSDLYRVPRCESPSQAAELLRYTRLEYGDVGLSWTEPAPSPTVSRVTGIRKWLATYLGFGSSSARAAQPGPIRAGLAAVHFGGELPREDRAQDAESEPDHPCDILATSALILTVQPTQPHDEDVLASEH